MPIAFDPAPTPVAGQAPTEAQVHDAVAALRRAAWSRSAEGQRAIAAQSAAHTILASTSDQDRLVANAAQRLIDARAEFDQAKDDYLTARNAWMAARDELRDLTR